MKPILVLLSGLVALAIVFVSAGAARAEEGNASFRVHNNLDQTVGVWVASEKSSNPNPWAHVDVAPDKEATFTLQSPDRFVVAVDVGKQRSRSKPVALKAFLAAHPSYVLQVDIERVTGFDPNAPEQPTRYRLDFVPTKPAEENSVQKPAIAAPPEKSFFDFGPDTDSGQKGE